MEKKFFFFLLPAPLFCLLLPACSVQRPFTFFYIRLRIIIHFIDFSDFVAFFDNRLNQRLFHNFSRKIYKKFARCCKIVDKRA
jgi:hypothetical protein